MNQNELRVSCLTDFNEADHLKDQWNKLSRGNPMLSWQWLRNWWEEIGGSGWGEKTLALGVVKDWADQILGIAPLYVVSGLAGNTIRFLGDGKTCTDYIDFLATEGSAEMVGQCIARWIISPAFVSRFGSISALTFEGSSQHSWGILACTKQLATSGWKVCDSQLESSWWLDLSGGWPQVLKDFQYSQVRKTKKAIKRMEAGEFQLELISEKSEFPQAWADFVDLHQKRRKILGQPGCFADPMFQRFLGTAIEELMPVGQAKLAFLKHQGERIAVNLILLGDDTVFNYQNGSDPAYLSVEPGHALNSFLIRWSCMNGFQRFDFLRGDESYKRAWGTLNQKLSKTCLVPPTLAARTKQSLIDTAKILRDQSFALWACSAKSINTSILGNS